VNVFETVREKYPYIAGYGKYNNAAVFLMSKDSIDEKVILAEEELSSFPDFVKEGEWIYNKDKYFMLPSTMVYQIDTASDYGPEFAVEAGKLTDRKNRYYRVETYGYAAIGSQLTITISAERDGQILQRFGENFWIGHDVDEALHFPGNDTIPFRAQFSFQIPDFIEDSDRMKIGLWKRNGSIILVPGPAIFAVENIWN
jgi:hypothetical protein